MRAPQPPNDNVLTAQWITADFLKDVTDITNTRLINLVNRNHAHGGSLCGYTFKGLKQIIRETDEYIPEIHPSLEEEAEALYLRMGNLAAVRTKVEQAVTSICVRCKCDTTTIRDALPDAFVAGTRLAIYSRGRPQAYFLKAHPMLAAPYRAIDEAILFRDRYRLLD